MFTSVAFIKSFSVNLPVQRKTTETSCQDISKLFVKVDIRTPALNPALYPINFTVKSHR